MRGGGKGREVKGEGDVENGEGKGKGERGGKGGGEWFFASVKINSWIWPFPQDEILYKLLVQ